MSERLRILVVIDSLKIGGAEMLLVDFARACRRRGHDVLVAYFTPGPLTRDLTDAGVECVRLGHRGLATPLPVLALIRHIRRWRPDVVHTHLRKSDLAGQLAARLCGIAARLSTAHNTDPWRRRRLLSWLERALVGPCLRIAVSDEVGRYMCEVGGCDPHRVITVRNGVDTGRFDPQATVAAAAAREWNDAGGCRLVGIVGRIEPQKDHATFVEAACRVARSYADVRFVIVGDGPLRGDVEALCRVSGYADRFVFAGLQRDMPGVFKALTMVVFSSRWEGLPVALLEAMAMATPVVATRVGGIGAVLDDAGIMVAPQDAAALGDAMSALLADPDRAADMGRRGRDRVLAGYSTAQTHEATFDLYRRLLGGEGVRGGV